MPHGNVRHMDPSWVNAWGAFVSALRDALPVMKPRLWWYVGMAAIAASIDYFVAQQTPHEFLEHGAVIAATFVGVGYFFTLASAIRSVMPDYEMELGDVLGLIGWSIVLCLMTAIGIVLLILPGLWVVARFGPLPQVYALLRAQGSDESAFTVTYDETQDRYWHCLGLIVLLSILSSLGDFGDRIGSIVPFSSGWGWIVLVVSLVTFAIGIWVQQVTQLALVRWVAVKMLPSAPGADEDVPVPAAP